MNSRTHKLMNSQSYDIFYKTHLVWPSILEKIKAEKQVFSRFFCVYYLHFAPFSLSSLLPTRIFFNPQNRHLATKCH